MEQSSPKQRYVRELLPDKFTSVITQHIRKYCRPRRIASDMKMSLRDVQSIVLIVLYLIHKEPTICTAKLECYMLLLNMNIHEEMYMDVSLLIPIMKSTPYTILCRNKLKISNTTFNVANTRILDISKIMSDMKRKGFIEKGTNTPFVLGVSGLRITEFFEDLDSIKTWLDEFLCEWHDKDAQSMLGLVLCLREKVIASDEAKWKQEPGQRPMRDFLTIREASNMLMLPMHFLLRLCVQGKIEGAIHLTSSLWIIPKSSIHIVWKQGRRRVY